MSKKKTNEKVMTLGDYRQQNGYTNEITLGEYQERRRQELAEQQRQQYQQAVKNYTRDYNNLMLSNTGIRQPVKSGEKVSMSDFMNPFQRRSEYKKSAVKAGLWTQEEYDADKKEAEDLKKQQEALARLKQLGQPTKADLLLKPGTIPANRLPKAIPQQPAEEKQEKANPYAFYGKGNIDLSARPKVKNEDGSYSTVDSFSVNIDGKEVLLPSIVNGKRVSEKEAIKHYRETGENLGTFNTPDEASAYAEQLHNLQEMYYSGNGKVNPFVNKAQDELLKDPGFRTETVRNSAMDKDISGLSNDAQAMVQMVRYEMQRNTRADAIGKMAAGFAQDHQNFKDPIGAFSEAAPIISAMMDEYTGKTNPEYQARTLTRPFNEQSALEQMADPNSSASRTVVDIKEMNDAKDRKRFNLMLQLMDIEDMQKGAYENLGSWFGEKTDDVNNYMNLENAQRAIETLAEARNEGLLDYGTDPETMSSASRRKLSVKLENENKALERDVPEIRKQLDELDAMIKNSWNASPEEMMRDPKYQLGFNVYLDTLGLQMDADGYIVDSEGNSAASPAISFFYDYMENVLSADNRKKMDRLQSNLEAAEAKIRNNNRTLEQINRYNTLDKAHEILMDPEGSAQRYQKLSEEYRALRDQYDLSEDPAEQEALEPQLRSMEKELDIYDSYTGMFGDGDYGKDTEFHPEYDRGQDVASANARMNRNDTPKRDTSVHGIYSFINGGKEFEYWRKGNDKDLITKEYHGAMAMLPEEKAEFNRLYNDAIAEGREPKEAQAFLEGLQPFLNQRLRDFEELDVRQTARRLPILSSIASLGMSATAPYQAVATIGGKLLGDQNASDPNSWMFASTRAQNAIEGQVASDLGDVGGFVYQAGMSGLKNFVRGITSMGFGAAAPAVNLLEFAGEAFMSSYQQELENTGNPDASFLYAMTEAGISTLFEVVSVEKLFSDPTKYMNYLLQNMGAEMSEEFFENVFSPYIHEFFNGRNEWKERADQIIADGGYTDAAGNWVKVDDNNAKEAWRQACREWNSNIVKSVGSAALSVGGPAAFGGLRLSMADRETGKAIMNQGVTKGMDRKAASKLQTDNVYDLVKPSLEMKEGTETRRIAESIDKKMQDGQKINPKEIGKLASAIMRESDAQIGGIAQDVLGEAFLKRLKVRGKLEQKDAAEITQALVRVVTTNVLSGEDMAIISRSEEAENILQEYGDSEERRRFMEETEKARNVQTSLMELVTGSNKNSVSENDVSSMMDGSMMATPEEIEEAEAAGGKPASGTAVIANGKYGEITGFGKRTEIIKDENGKAHKETVVTVTIGEGENAETVDLSSVKAVGEGMARALRFIDMDGGQTVSNALGKTLLKVASEAKNVSGAVADAMSVMWAQVTGQRQARVTNLSAEEEAEIRTAVQEDMDAADEERLKNWREFKPGQGTTNYNGISYGTKEFKQALNADIKDEQIVREALTIASIAKSAGVDVTLYYDAENTAKQGVFFSGNGISINLAGTYDKEGTHRSALATFAHELTHNLEANSLEAYKALRTFVMQNLKRFGYDLNRELRDIMETYKAHDEPLDLAGAMAEMVAKGCEQVLTDGKLIAELKEQDPTLYGNMKKAIRKVVGMMTGVKGAAIATSSRYAKAMSSITSDVARVWKLAYEEALGAKGIGTAEGAAQASMQEQDRQYEQAVKNGDWETAESMLLDKMQRTEGITGYNAPYFYTGEHQDIAKLIKSGNPEVIQAVVREMAPKVPENAVLIPMPPHEGKVLDSTDTMILARALSEATGRPVINALESDFHESRYAAKAAGKRNVNAKSMGFRQIAEIPEGTMPVFIDNMVGGGQTAIAAKNAIGRGITLAYAQSARSKSKGVKFTSVTYDNNGKLIPLSQRMDPNNPSWKYSIQELPNGKKYVNVDTDQNIFDNADYKDYPKIVAKYITNRFRGTIIGNTNKAYVDKKTALEYSHPASHKIPADIFEAKARASTELDNLMDAATYIGHNDDDGRHPEAVGGWDHYSVMLYVPNANKYYEGIISIEKVKKGDRFHDLSKLKDVTSAVQGQSASLAPGNASVDNISQNDNISKTQRSITEEDREYLASVNLGYFGSAEKMVDAAAKRAGYTIKAYHGTPNGKFNTFDKSKVGTSTDFGKLGRGFYFSTKKQVADYYAGYLPSSTVMPVYLKLDNPFVLDHNYDNMSVRELYDSILGKGGIVDEERSEELTQWLIDNGYDGIEADGEYMVLDPKNIKSAETVTYDKYGDVIPLSERFRTDHEESWQDTDIRYSIQEQDEQYDAAVKAGDMETAQQIVDNVAKEKGFSEKVYHGTPTGGFTVFRDWSYFTKSKAYADRYRHTSASSSRAYSVEATQPQTYELYMNPGKVFDTRNPKAARIYNEARMEYGLGELSNTNSGLPDWTDGRDIIEFIEEKGLDYDTILLDEGGDPGENGPVSRGISYVTRNNRIKSAEAVTYDNKGKVIPPSERFNIKENDIRFSMQEPVEVNRDGLIAVHNLGEDQLIKTIQLGGFPMPSIAIIKNDYAHNRYGDISVVFYPSTIDPRASRDNKVYGGDAWTPTYPSIEYKINSKELSRVTKKLQKLVPESVWNSNGNYVHLYEENLENSLNSSRGDVVSALSNVDVLKIAYMEDTGKKIEYPTRETDLDGFHRFKNDQVLRVLEVLGEDTVREAYEGGWDYYNEHPEVIEKIRQTLNEMFREKHKNVGLKIAQMDLYSADKFGPNYAQMIVDAANRYMNEGIQTETDSAKMWEQLKELNEDEDYQEWVRNQFGNIIEKKGIRNSKDVFTNNGNRRSWDALHDEETLENVVRMMKAQADKGSNSFFSQSEMLALGTRDLKSLEDIRKHSGQLKHISDEEMSAAKTEIVNGFSELMEELRNKKESNQFIARDRALEAMVEAVRKTRTPEGIMRELKRYGDLDVPADAGVRIANLMQQIADLPTEYFEAKPQRAVELNEIAKVIVPETASKELLKELDMRDIPYEFYDGTDEGRLQALNNQEDAQFSFMDETDVDARAWMETVQESSLQTEAEKSLLRNFKALRMRVSLKQEQERKYRGEIARLEAIPDGERTREQKSKLAGYKVRLENATKVKEQAQEELSRITSSSGYVSMMYRQQRVLNDFVYGRTQEEVRSAVERLERSAETIEKRIRANREAAEALEKSGIVDRFRKLLGTTTADQTAAELKKAYNSTWTKAQIRTYLDPIIAKMMAGENFEQDVEELAGILVNSDSTNNYEELSGLRGLTIRLGKGAMAELRAQNSSLKEVRARLAGTGIQVVQAKDIRDASGNVVDHERSTLEADIEDLRAEYPSIPDLGNEKDALGNFLDWIDGMKQASAANEFYEQRIAEAMAVITGKAAGAAKGIYMPNDSRAQKQVLAMMDFVKSLNAETAKAQKDLQDIADELEKMRKAGQQASGMANTMAHDANVAIDYFNRMARIAEDTAKQKTRKDLVEQLKSEHAKKIAKNNEEWRELIQRDRDARKQLEKNRAYANRINTVLKRAYNRLKAPKGLQNVPEYMQGLVREVLGIFVDNDLAGGRRFTAMSRESLAETRRVLDEWIKESGEFNRDQLKDAEEAVEATLSMDLMIIRDGIAAINGDIRGKNKVEILQTRGEILKEMQEAVSEIWSAVMAENTIQIRSRKIAVEDAAYKIATQMGNRRAKEWTGSAGGIMRTLHKAIISGNMTPEYFFRTLGNAGLSDLWEGYHEAENRNGLELAKAKARMEEIAKKYGYSTWDVNQKVTLELSSGAQVQMTIGQLMSLYATWKRETALGPAVSEHLAGGGFYAEQDLRDGILGRTEVEKKAHRIKVERNEKGEIVASPDMMRVEGLLTDEQKQFVDEVVGFMSSDMSELGNEASMKAYGIKLYKEGYYFPFQMWDGVKSRKSSDAGSAAAAQDRAFHPSFSKSRMHGANNALIIGDFMQTVSDHVAGMINYATMGLANENLQKTLNFQLSEEYSEEETNKRNIWTMIEEAYGKEAAQYLRELQQQLNGGAVRIDKTFYDKLISLFRKNAVAGSLSVAAQQPMSYIRAAVLINPKYLAAAMNPATWKGSYAEMMAHSGVAVIKDMGRFDMNFGQSAREYLMPDALEGKASRTWEFIKDKATILPEMMDRMTWTRMWSACKAEMKALHPEMDVKSDEFLDMVGERFNELMRRTQVYDSVLVKSANMRNQNPGVKMLTSFMAEPTLTANVLADAVRSAVRKEKGGKLLLARAGATFILSAVMQAAIKGAFGAGRNPDESKNEWENFLYRFWSNLFGEIDPLTLVPGYSTAIDLLKGSDISDNALGMVGKIFDAGKTGVDALLGTKSKGAWRDVEDSVGQLMQIFTGLPAKNLMRDARAMYNFVTGKFESTSPYAWRPTNTNITGNQFMEKLMTADNLLGVVNQWLGDAGYATDNNAYYKRIYDAKKTGDEKTAENLIDYLLTGGKVKKRETIDSKVAAMAKDDAEMSAEDTAEFLIGEGANAETYIKDQLKQGKMSAEDARKMLKKADPQKTDDDVWWTVDRIEYQLENGMDQAPNEKNYYRFNAAVRNNSATEIQSAVKDLLGHGFTKEKIKSQLGKWKSEYLAADSNGKRKIRDAMQKAYKAIGLTAADADKAIEKWEKDAKKKKN